MPYIDHYRVSSDEYDRLFMWYQEHGGSFRTVEKFDAAGAKGTCLYVDAHNPDVVYANSRICYIAMGIVPAKTTRAKYGKVPTRCWTQMRRDESLAIHEEDMSGIEAYYTMRRYLLKYYTVEEYEARLKMFEADAVEDKHELHYWNNEGVALPKYRGKVRVYTNCRAYDLNSAYGDALRTIFPAAAEMIEKLYEERKVKPENKKLLNYFIGFLKRQGHERTRNWIVQSIRAKMDEAIKRAFNKRSKLIYANTDGFVIQNGNKLPTSTKLGDFKMEYDGTVYCYDQRDVTYSTYWAMQVGDKLKSNAPLRLRDSMQLSKGQAIMYKKTKNGKVMDYKLESVEVLSLIYV